MTWAWFHWPVKANRVRFIEDCTVMWRRCWLPTLSNRKYFACGVPPRPRQDPRHSRAKLTSRSTPRHPDL